jgi:hypothetical protein
VGLKRANEDWFCGTFCKDAYYIGTKFDVAPMSEYELQEDRRIDKTWRYLGFGRGKYWTFQFQVLAHVPLTRHTWTTRSPHLLKFFSSMEPSGCTSSIIPLIIFTFPEASTRLGNVEL